MIQRKHFAILFLSLLTAVFANVRFDTISPIDPYFQKQVKKSQFLEAKNKLESNTFFYPSRELVFVYYWQNDEFQKARLELNNLIQQKNDAISIYYQAVLALAEGDNNQVQVFVNKILGNNRRFLEAGLLQAYIQEESGYIQQAKNTYKTQILYHPQSARLHYMYGLYLYRTNPREVIQTLNILEQIERESPEFYHLNALFKHHKNEPDAALASIEKALHYLPSKPEYFELKKEILYKLNRIDQLISALDISATYNAPPEQLHYFAHLQSLKHSQEDYFDLANEKIADRLVIEPLKNAVLNGNDRENTRLFLEYVVLENKAINAPIRSELSGYYQSLFDLKLEQGDLPLSEWALKRALFLNPQNPEIHKSLSAMYHNQNKLQRALHHLNLYNSLIKEENYRLDTQIQLLEKRLQTNIASRYQLDYFPRALKKFEISVPKIIYNTTQTKNSAIVLNEFMLYTLKTIERADINYLPEYNLSALADVDSDYFLELTLEEKQNIFSIEYKLYLAENVSLIDSGRILTDGKYRILQGSERLQKKLTESIPLSAAIVHVDKHLAIIPINQYELNEMNGYFQVSDSSLNSFRLNIMESDENFSVLKPENPLNQKYLRNGLQLQFVQTNN